MLLMKSAFAHQLRVQRSTVSLVKKGQSVAASYDRDYIVVVRRLADPAVAGQGNPDFFSSFVVLGGADEAVELGEPVHAVRLYRDGHDSAPSRFALCQRR